MATAVTLDEVEGQVKTDDSWGQWRDVAEYVEPVKIVFGAFVDGLGDADVWAEVVLGSRCEFPIRITSVNIVLEEGQPELTSAPTTTTREESDERGYLWCEPEEAWTTMYEEYERIDGSDAYFRERGVRPSDRTFAYTLGSDDDQQRVLSTPVSCTVNDRSSPDEHRSIYEIDSFRSLASDRVPELAPKAVTAEELGDPDAEAYREYVDAISFWIKWCSDDLTENLGSGEFGLSFSFDSNIGAVNHIYAYYTLPPGARLIGSQSAVSVTSFKPSQTRWMFNEWRRRYGVNRAGARDGTDRMTRSKVRNAVTLYNSGRYQDPRMRAIDGAAQWALGFVYIVSASVLLQLAVVEPTTVPLITAAVGLVVLLVLGIWTHQSSITPVTRLLYRVQLALDRFTSTMTTTMALIQELWRR